MRARMAASFPGDNLWDLKYAPGGLVDIEFIAQALQLAQADPAVLDTNTEVALLKLTNAGALAAEDAATLVGAARLEHALTQVLRIALDAVPKAEEASPGLKALLARAAGEPSFATLQTRLVATQAQVRAIFQRLMAAAQS
jgi:glutamate-ammonia-ligase adenylyltransferase